MTEDLPPPVMVPQPHSQPLPPPPGPVAEPLLAAQDTPPPHASEPPPRGPSLSHKEKARLAAFQAGTGPLPLGYSSGAHFRTQVENGVAARMMLYEYDFACGSEQLNLRGKDRLLQIAYLLGHFAYPVVIERTPYAPALAEARRLAVLHELSQGPVPVPPERVVIGPAIAIPLQGWEAVIIYQNLETRTQAGGVGLTGGAGGGRTTGASGSGVSGGTGVTTGR
jgi:hypothetical protein